MAWAIALFAMIGSLYFQYVMNLAPCVLCWYQRIFMYPLVFILLVGILIKEAKVHLYVLPLSIIGLAIALYHNLLYYKVIPESLAPCVQAYPALPGRLSGLGFISIPLLSLTAFCCDNRFDGYSREGKTSMKKQIIIIVSIAVVVLGGAVVLFLKGNGVPPADVGKPVDSKKLLRDTSHSTGKLDAKVVVVEFGDYQCPACAGAEPAVGEVNQRPQGRL